MYLAASQQDVVIVGGGFSAACLAIHLLRAAPGELSITIVHSDARIARGIAYRTECDTHILNVPAAKMSILSEEPSHFVDWLSGRHAFDGGHFVPRRIYGEYIEATLEDEQICNPQVSLRWIHDTVTSLIPDASGTLVLLHSGKSIRASMAVLAVGNSPPQSPAPFASLSAHRYKANAWADDAPSSSDPSHDVLVVGSGLTAVDQVLALSREDRTGKIVVLSRRGRLPSPHGAYPPWPAEWTKSLPSNIRLILTIVREQVELAQSAGACWRSVIDSLRQATPNIWQSLAPEEKRRFIRHVRPYWEIARHRIPARTHDKLKQLITSRRMVLLAGRITRADELENCLEVTYTERNSFAEKQLVVDRIINCTGPGTVIRVHDALFSDLLDRNLARLDPLGFGIETDADGALIEASGEPSQTIFAIGPVRKPSLWESTAVAEIRMQARELAATIALKLAFERETRIAGEVAAG